MKSKEIKNEDPAAPSEQDNNEIITGRSNIISNLRRLNTMVVPTPNVRHPFGPSGQRIASIVHEEDDAHDIMQAILSTIRNRTIPQELGTLGSDISNIMMRNLIHKSILLIMLLMIIHMHHIYHQLKDQL